MNLGEVFGIAFLLSGGWFWFVLLAEVFFLSISCWKGNGFTWLVTVALAALFIGFSDLSAPFVWVSEHPYETASVIVGYIGIGAVYSIAKWWLFIREDRNIQTRKNDYETYKKWAQSGPTADRTIPTFDDFFASSWNTLTPSRYKSTIMAWMVVWPLSGAWTLTHDIFENIYASLVKIYTNISSRHAQSILKD